MTRVERAKKALLRDVATILERDDELCQSDDEEGPEYEAFIEARRQLVEEFERRSKERGR